MARGRLHPSTGHPGDLWPALGQSVGKDELDKETSSGRLGSLLHRVQTGQLDTVNKPWASGHPLEAPLGGSHTVLEVLI